MTFPDFFDKMKLKKALSKEEGDVGNGTFVYILTFSTLLLF